MDNADQVMHALHTRCEDYLISFAADVPPTLCACCTPNMCPDPSPLPTPPLANTLDGTAREGPINQATVTEHKKSRASLYIMCERHGHHGRSSAVSLLGASQARPLGDHTSTYVWPHREAACGPVTENADTSAETKLNTNTSRHRASPYCPVKHGRHPIGKHTPRSSKPSSGSHAVISVPNNRAVTPQLWNSVPQQAGGSELRKMQTVQRLLAEDPP